MKIHIQSISLLLFLASNIFSVTAASESNSDNQKKRRHTDRMELETLKIQGNKELPKVLFVVPWQDVKSKKEDKEEQGLILHSLYGDLFDPVNPTEF